MTTAEVTRFAAPALPEGRPRLVLTGFMGTGKTSAGTRAAAILGLPFVDVDDAIERRTGRSVAQTFAGAGESAFRDLERDAIADAARLSAAVIATGGGAVLDAQSFAALADGSVVATLAAPPEELARRIGGDGSRPLLGPDPLGRIRELLHARAPAYAAAGGALETAGRHVDDVAGELADRWRAAQPSPHARVEVRVGGGGYPVVAGEGAIGSLGDVLREVHSDCTSALVVADAAVADGAASRVAASLARAGLAQGAVIAVPGGEGAKDIAAVTRLWERFVERGVERSSAIVAVGGGATLDAIGFAAATFARGVPLVNVPTTLLAMVDAGLGGKVAVDHAGLKNIAGAFHHPLLVVCDTDVLAGLPARERRAGMAEVVKMAVLASPLQFEHLEREPLDADGIPLTIGWHVEQAIRIKAAYVSADPGDRAERLSLNLGHTYAHAIEAASAYDIAHGEAVAIGTVAAARLGAMLGLTPIDLADRLRGVFGRLGLPAALPSGIARDGVAAAFAGDKKRRGGEPRFIVPVSGGAALVPVPAERAMEALA